MPVDAICQFFLPLLFESLTWALHLRWVRKWLDTATNWSTLKALLLKTTLFLPNQMPQLIIWGRFLSFCGFTEFHHASHAFEKETPCHWWSTDKTFRTELQRAQGTGQKRKRWSTDFSTALHKGHWLGFPKLHFLRFLLVGILFSKRHNKKRRYLAGYFGFHIGPHHHFASPGSFSALIYMYPSLGEYSPNGEKIHLSSSSLSWILT